jgi:excisionase family DNA binding protein
MRTHTRVHPSAPRVQAGVEENHVARLEAAGRVAPGRLFTADDVAEVLGVPRHFVYTLARRGDLPTVRVGERYVRFRVEALEQWIAEQESTVPRYLR